MQFIQHSETSVSTRAQTSARDTSTLKDTEHCFGGSGTGYCRLTDHLLLSILDSNKSHQLGWQDGSLVYIAVTC